MFVKINSGKLQLEIRWIQFPVPLKPEPEQGFEIPVLDWLEPVVKKYIPVPATRTGIFFRQILFPVPVLKTPLRSFPNWSNYQDLTIFL